jgi:hypothetical protein
MPSWTFVYSDLLCMMLLLLTCFLLLLLLSLFQCFFSSSQFLIFIKRLSLISYILFIFIYSFSYFRFFISKISLVLYLLPLLSPILLSFFFVDYTFFTSFISSISSESPTIIHILTKLKLSVSSICLHIICFSIFPLICTFYSTLCLVSG